MCFNVLSFVRSLANFRFFKNIGTSRRSPLPEVMLDRINFHYFQVLCSWRVFFFFGFHKTMVDCFMATFFAFLTGVLGPKSQSHEAVAFLLRVFCSFFFFFFCHVFFVSAVSLRFSYLYITVTCQVFFAADVFQVFRFLS